MKQGQQHIEQRDHRGQMSLHKGFQAMEDPFETTDNREQRERGLNDHAVIPGAFGTQLAVLRHAVLATEAVIGQDNAASAELLDQRMKFIIWRVHRIPIPIDHLAKAIENPTQLDADAPTPFVFGFLAKLLGATTFPNGKQQFNRIAVNHQEETRIGQKSLVPILMSDQQPLYPCAIRQTGKQGVVVAFEPAVKGTKVTSLQGKQQADRDSLTRIQLGLTVLGDLFHLVIDKAKDLDDNVFSGHKDSSFREWVWFSLLNTIFVTTQLAEVNN